MGEEYLIKERKKKVLMEKCLNIRNYFIFHHNRKNIISIK